MRKYPFVDIEEIEYNMKVGYPNFINEIIEIENKLISILKRLAKENVTWLDNHDVRLSVFDRYLSQIVPTRISLQLLNEFVAKPNWHDKYQEMFQPKDIPLKPNGYIYFKELDLSFRFSHYQQIFCQLESTIKNIAYFYKSIGNSASENWYNFLITNLKIRTVDDNFLILIKEIRNTIHNNGIYISKDHNSKIIQYKGISYKFINGKTIDINWGGILFLTNEIIDFTLEIINDDIVKKHVKIVDLIEN